MMVPDLQTLSRFLARVFAVLWAGPVLGYRGHLVPVVAISRSEALRRHQVMIARAARRRAL